MNYKIENGTLLLYKDGTLTTEKQDLYVQGAQIVKVGNENPDASVDWEIIDAKNQLVMPGLINMHTHAYMTIVRNYADDVDFGEWLFNRVMPVEDKLPVEAAYWTNQLAFAEMFKTGTTSYVDMHMYRCQSAKAAKDAGIRAFIGRGLVGEDLFGDGMRRYQEALDEKAEYESDRISFILSPHAIYSASVKLYQQVAEEAKKLGLHKQTHLSEGMVEIENCLKEHGKTPVQLLEDIGWLDNETILAHCVQMQGDDIEILGRHGVTVVTNPASNAKLGNGFAPVTEMEGTGINLCIGTDGTSSNNTLNMFREMGLLTLIHKGIKRDSTAMPAVSAINAATVNGAKGLGMEGKLGLIKEGAAADLTFVDLREPSLFPNNNIISSLCYSANGSEVKSVMVNGQMVMKNRELLTIDLDRVYYEVGKIVEEYL